MIRENLELFEKSFKHMPDLTPEMAAEIREAFCAGAVSTLSGCEELFKDDHESLGSLITLMTEAIELSASYIDHHKSNASSVLDEIRKVIKDGKRNS